MVAAVHTSKSPDTIIVGAGILGLWAARHAIKRGERVLVLEKRTVGAGASGGYLGALMPHMPDSWNAKKQFQYEGLYTLEQVIAELESDTGLDCGYRRCGRIMPLTHEKMLGHADKRIEGARQYWGSAYSMELLDSLDCKGWINPETASHGIQKDSLSARISPRSYMSALAAFVRPIADLREGVEVASIEMSGSCTGGSVRLANGDAISADTIVVANGWEAYPLLQPFMGRMNNGKSIGRGVKGQAVLLEFDHADDLPIVYHDGSYVVPHAGSRVAIGSTSVNDWQSGPNPQPDGFDPADLSFYHKAIDLVPALRNAPIVGHWAGVRPRNTLEGRGTSPWFGPVLGHEGLVALIGGFKITLGVAHLDRVKIGFAE